MEMITNWSEIMAKKDARIAELEVLVKFYEEQFRLSKHRQFGSSSEKSGYSDQLGLFDEAENAADLQKPEPELEEIAYTRRKRIGKRKDDLSVLPVETVEYKLPEEERACSECGQILHEMGHDTRRELVVIPAQVKVVEHRRAVYSCRNCERHGEHVPFVKAAMPEPLINGSLASPSAVAHIMTQKYVMHAPLYRQEQNWKRQGVSLSRQTMANWIIRCSDDWLSPIYERMKALLRMQDVLHADETTVQILREPNKPAVSNSYMWLYRTSADTNRHIVIFEYQPSRSSAHPKQFLKDFKGFLHTDGYAAYHTLSAMTVVGCWVHMRRKFEEALKAVPSSEREASSANDAIRHIGLLFHLEDQWKNLAPKERQELRLQKSKPQAEAFFGWLQTLRVLPKTAMGKAVNYALEQRKWLMNVYIDGRTEISNNRAENAIRPFALGRKNWLFCNSVKGATSSSVVYSLIETAKANDLLPFEYLKFLLEAVPSTSVGGLDALLPWGDAVPEKCHMPMKKENL